MTKEKIIQLSESSFVQAREIRRQLHRFPELGRKEYNTTKLIISHLEGWGIEYYTPIETGVVAIIRGENTQGVVALRADIDALPIKEMTNEPFTSENEGIMHACGHDFHTAALLCAAKIFNENRGELKKDVVCIFQPDEEGDGGAQRLIEKGVMNGIDEIYGIHVAPEYNFQTVAVKHGDFYAASDIFEIDVKGRSGHGAQPHKNIDAILVASHIIVALQSVISRGVNPVDSAVLTVGTVKGGNFRNTVAGKCEITGILRSFGKNNRDKLSAQVIKIAKSIAEAYGAEAEVRIIESYPGIHNHYCQTEYIKNCAGELVSEKNVIVLEKPGMVSEDFGYYLEKIPGCFYHVGCGSDYGLHSERFSPDEKALKTMMSMHLVSVYGI